MSKGGQEAMEATAETRGVKISVQMPAELHRALRVRTAEESTTIRSYVMGLIERDMYGDRRGADEVEVAG
jgi:hypothetical protein